jgi:hypothetical protein
LNRNSIPWLLTALLLAGLAVYTHAPAQTATLQGTFTYVPEKSDNVDQAIEVAVSKLNFFVRSMARKRLRELNEPYQRIAIELTPTQVSITADHGAPIRTAPDGTPGAWKDADVEVLQVSTRWEGSVLKQEFSAKNGQRINAYEVSADDQTLTMQVTISSQRLKEPVKYRLVYRRV